MKAWICAHARQLETLSMTIMVAGFVFLCQPWFHLLFRYSVTTMLVGLVMYNIFSRVPQRPLGTAGRQP
ncbi:hypothetical protein NF212_23530 [Parasalinivibrio latis]|uniref:hypothetical protein n=1 Tax=Parasalinivibrio latis TaxID=2952610 RepID=UPI0030E11497